MDVIFVLDNRILGNATTTFEQESSEAASRQLQQVTLQHYLASSAAGHSWAPVPLALLVAASPQTTRAILNIPKNKQELLDSIAPRFSTSNTWAYLNHAIEAITDQIKKRTNVQLLQVILFMTDLSLASNQGALHLEKGIKMFIQSINKLESTLKLLKIRFVCPIISALPFQFNALNEEAMHTIEYIKRQLFYSPGLEDIFTVQTFPNTGLHYEEELRAIYESLSQSITAKLALPKVGSSKLSDVVIDLSAYTKTTQDKLHVGLQSLSLYSISSRNTVNPLYLHGSSLIVHASTTLKGPAKQSNDMVFQALLTVLVEHDLLLILKVPFQEKYTQYWALIPPLHIQYSGQTHMVMMQLVVKEDVLRSSPMIDEQPVVLDKQILSDYTQYIQQALKLLGPQSDYNPLTCVGGFLYDTVTATTTTNNHQERKEMSSSNTAQSMQQIQISKMQSKPKKTFTVPLPIPKAVPNNKTSSNNRIRPVELPYVTMSTNINNNKGDEISDDDEFIM